MAGLSSVTVNRQKREYERGFESIFVVLVKFRAIPLVVGDF
jgi:hypothetical protein